MAKAKTTEMKLLLLATATSALLAPTRILDKPQQQVARRAAAVEADVAAEAPAKVGKVTPYAALTIGVVSESDPTENRVAQTPESLARHSARIFEAGRVVAAAATAPRQLRDGESISNVDSLSSAYAAEKRRAAVGQWFTSAT